MPSSKSDVCRMPEISGDFPISPLQLKSFSQANIFAL